MKKLFIVLAFVIICVYVIPVSAQETVVSQGKHYELITPASSAYPDTNAYKLTNGIYASPATGASSDTSAAAKSYYQSTEYVGFNQTAKDTNGNFVILLDLGAPNISLSSFEISYLNETDTGIYSPASVTFSISTVRNGNYTAVGTATTNDLTTGGLAETKKATVTPDGAVSGQYVMVIVTPKSSITNESGGTFTPGWVFLDEITVRGTAAATESVTDSSAAIPQTGDGVSVIVFAFLGITAFIILLNILDRKRQKDD